MHSEIALVGSQELKDWLVFAVAPFLSYLWNVSQRMGGRLHWILHLLLTVQCEKRFLFTAEDFKYTVKTGEFKDHAYWLLQFAQT
jgi:hypothetical protein